MTIEIELDGRRQLVTLRREGDQWVAGLGGREVPVSVIEAGGRWSMLVGPRESGAGSRTSYDVSFESPADGELVVHVNGVAVPLTIIGQPGTPKPWAKATRGKREGSEAGADTQSHVVIAPMPGRIVKVLVRPGEAVQARQGLVVVEAMKMENELRAPRDGTVAEVRVTEGSSVEANAVLVVLR